MRVIDRSLQPWERAWVPTMVVVILLLLVANEPYFEATRNANERPRLLQGIALVEEGSFRIDGPSARGLDPGPDVAKGVDGRIYPNKPPGSGLVAAVAYLVARAMESGGGETSLRDYTFAARVVGAVVPTLLLAWLALGRYIRLFGAAQTSLAVLAYVACTPVWSYGHLFYAHQLTACLWFCALGFLFAPDRREVVSARGPIVRREIIRAAVGGGLAGCALAVEYGALFTAAPIGVGLVSVAVVRGGWRRVFAALGGAAVVLVGLLAYQKVAFGSPWSTGYHHVVVEDFARRHGQGFLGLEAPSWDVFYVHVLSPGGGLLWWAPLVPLGLYGLAQVSLEPGPHRAEARVLFATFVLYVVVVSGLAFEGGWRVGPRYLVPVFPALILGFARVAGELRTHSGWLFVTAALATFGLIANGLTANLWPHFDLAHVSAPLAEVVLPLWRESFVPHSLLAAFLPGRVSPVTAVVIFGFVILAIVALKTIEVTWSNLLACLAGAAVGVAAITATSLLPRHPDEVRNLAYVRSVWEPKSGVGD